MAANKFVTYLRVSTNKQGESGLGLDAQRAAVQSHIARGDGEQVEEVLEVETGTRSDRPELVRAMRLCRIHGATLLIAKLDRLSRNVAFLSKLLEEKVPFVAADIPNADVTHTQMLGVFAEHEARVIKARTKAALAQSKKKLGGRRVTAERFAEIAAIGRKVSMRKRSLAAQKKADDLIPEIKDMQAGGITSLRQVADALNKRNITTARGKQWSAVQVARVLQREKASA